MSDRTSLVGDSLHSTGGAQESSTMPNSMETPFSNEKDLMDDESIVTADPGEAIPPSASIEGPLTPPCSPEQSAAKELNMPIDAPSSPITPPVDGDAPVVSLGENKKKKKKKRSKGKSKAKKAREAITGFEEFYADAPLTPEEARLEEDIYRSSRSLTERIEDCIQRFREKRRLSNEQVNLFNKYLALGGIDTSVRQFTGHDPGALAGASKDDVRRMMATDRVGVAGGKYYCVADAEHWEVDFEGIAKCFFSRTLAEFFLPDETLVLAARTVESFLNFVLQHDVCPEFKENIMAARNICQIAVVENRNIDRIYKALPGRFDRAAYSLLVNESTPGKLNSVDKDEQRHAFRDTIQSWKRGSSDQTSDQASNDALEHLTGDASRIEVELINEGRPKAYEVVDIRLPRKDPATGVKNEAGSIIVRPAIIAHGYSNVPRPEEVDFSNAPVAEYLIDKEIIGLFEKGMKLVMTVYRTNMGVGFIKEVEDIRVSFDTFLPQMLMQDWKEPAENHRPAPSIHDKTPGLEEGFSDGREDDE